MAQKKVLFVHDGPILGNESQSVFYGVHYNDEIIARYSFFGDKVSFLMRYQVIDDSEAIRYSKIAHPSFNFIELPNFKSIRTYHKKLESIKIIKKAVDEHDVIILRLPSASGTIAFEYAKSINKPILIEMVACVYDALWNYDWRGKLLAKLKMKKYQAIVQEASHVIYVTNAFLQTRYPSNGKTIGCSDVVLRDIDNTILETRLAKIKSSSNVLTLGTVAAIDVPYKGQSDIIKVISKWRTNEKDYNYKIVGQGNPIVLQKNIDMYKVKSKVEILGSLSHDKVFEFIDDIDIYIQPSKQEGLPRAVIEAMSRACPVLGSDIAGIPELINQNALFEAGNLEAISNKLVQMDKDVLSKFANENFIKAQEFKKDSLDEKRIRFYKIFKEDYNLA